MAIRTDVSYVYFSPLASKLRLFGMCSLHVQHGTYGTEPSFTIGARERRKHYIGDNARLMKARTSI